MHNIAFCSEKVISSKSGEKYAQIKRRLQIIQNTFAVGGPKGMDFFTGGSIIMDWIGILARSDDLKLTFIIYGFVSNKCTSFLFIRH